MTHWPRTDKISLALFPRTERTQLSTLLLISLALISAACAVPLAPGYAVVEEKFSVHFTQGDTPRLLIHAQYELRNTGNKPLEFVDVVIPDDARELDRDVQAKITWMNFAFLSRRNGRKKRSASSRSNTS